MTFDTVDTKIAEVEFFLQKMTSPEESTAFSFYLSAFLSASRTSTLALQRFGHIPGFDEWYGPHREALKKNKLAKFFLEARNQHAHGGEYPVRSSEFSGKKVRYWFSPVKLKNGEIHITEDIVGSCRNFFLILLEIVYDCYVQLGTYIDPQQFYTKENFESIGRDIDHAEVEIRGWVMTSYIEEGMSEDDRWYELRSYVGECGINHLFHSYLGKVTPQPKLPDYLEEIEYSPEDRGWDYIPAGYETLDEYLNAMRNG